jgi:hypothetical protein
MKHRGNITIFDIMARRQRIMRRCLALLLVLVTVVTTCFTSRYTKDDAQAADSFFDLSQPQYMTYVIQEMQEDPTRKFIILEIVADESQAEFPYYAPAEYDIDIVDNNSPKDGVLKKMSYLTQSELAQGYLNNDGSSWFDYNGLNTYCKDQDIYVTDVDKSTSSKTAYASVSVNNLSFRTKKSAFSDEFIIQVENAFLELVVPDYYDILKDRLEVHVIEANDLKVEDIEDADLVYIHATNQGNAVQTNRLLSRVTGPGEDNTTKNRQSAVINATYTKNSDGSFTETAEPNNYLFSEYEFVEAGSAEDVRYQAVLEDYKKNNPDRLAFVTYQTVDVTDESGEVIGYYKSRDMNWEVAEKLLEYNMVGKEFPSAGVTAKLPVILSTDLVSDSSINAGRLAQTIYMVSIDQFQDDNNTSIRPYDIIKDCMNTDIEFYTVSGLRTAAFSYYNYKKTTSDQLYERYDAISNGSVAKGGDYQYYKYGCTDTVWVAVYDENGNWIENTQINTFVRDQLSQNTGYTFNNWSTSDLQAALLNNCNDVNALRDNFMSFPPRSALVPNSRYTDLDGKVDGYADRYTGATKYYAYMMIQWILGVHGADGSSGSGSSSITLNILEIEPCNDFTYTQSTSAGQKNTVQLLQDISANGNEYSYNADKNYYEVSTQTLTGVSKITYTVNVDCYTVNAFDGLTTDIISQYDIIYIGTNSGQLSAISTSSLVYYPQSDSYNSNDLTDLKAEEIKDFVKVGKILLLPNEMTSKNVDTSSEVFKMIKDIESEDSVVFYSDVNEVYAKYSSTLTPILSVSSTRTVTEKDDSGNVVKDESGNAVKKQEAIPISGSDLKYDGNGLIDTTTIVNEGFTIDVTGTNLKSGKHYCLTLLIDEDNDGVFGETESEYVVVQSFWASNDKTNSDFGTYIKKEDNGTYTLSSSVSIVLPTDYISDIIEWKIGLYEEVRDTTTDTATEKVPTYDFVSTDTGETIHVNRRMRNTVVGCTPVVTSGTETINVLQVTENSTLEKDTQLQALFSAVKDRLNYNVTIKSYNPTTESEALKSAISAGNYQMLIIGTGTYSSMSDELKNEILAWVDDEGEYADFSVLFMDDTDTKLSTMGLTLDTLGQKDGSTTTANKSATALQASTIAMLNDGQMNQFPYNIDDGDLTIGKSSAESYQLMLDFADKTEQTSRGIVVWDTLTGTTSGDYYYASYKDAINNYYMYTMGNITYTAIGQCNTDADRRLIVNAIIRCSSKKQWKKSPDIVVNNGVITADGYNIYVDLDEIKLEAENDATSADALRAEAYIINFTARNYDNKSETKKYMTGEMYWYPDPSDATNKVVLYTYTGDSRLESDVAREEKLTTLSPGSTETPSYGHQLTAEQYALLISQIESECVDIRIHVTNSDDLEAEKKVTFRQRKMYLLK